MTQEFSGNDINWKSGRGVSTLGALGITRFPDSFYIRSPRTNEIRLFIEDTQTNLDNEFFDGEAKAYRAHHGNISLQIWN